MFSKEMINSFEYIRDKNNLLIWLRNEKWKSKMEIFDILLIKMMDVAMNKNKFEFIKNIIELSGYKD